MVLAPLTGGFLQGIIKPYFKGCQDGTWGEEGPEITKPKKT